MKQIYALNDPVILEQEIKSGFAPHLTANVLVRNPQGLICSDVHSKTLSVSSSIKSGEDPLTALRRAFEDFHAISLAYECFSENCVSKHPAKSCGFLYSHSEEAPPPKTGEILTIKHYIQMYHQ